MTQLKNPTLIVGLGGTGFHCISKVKSFIKEEFTEIPSGIKFLGIDFDRVDNNQTEYKKMFNEESLLSANGDVSSEWLRISSGRDVDYELSIKNPEVNADIRFFEDNNDRKRTLLNTIGGFDLRVGAGQKRILGKIGISYSTNYDRVKNKIEDTIRPLEGVNIDGTANWDTITILLVNSFSGGAGAGMFLDVLFMLNKLSVSGKNIEILTFNFLPDVFLDGLSTSIFKNLVEPNTFAAITELEYIYGNVDEFRPTNYRDPIGTTKNLPKANFLVNQGSYNGSKMGLDSMIYSTSKTMFNLVLAGNGLDTPWSNFQAHMSGNVKGKKRIFCSLGYTEIVFNIETLKKYTISKILNKSWSSYNGINTSTAAINSSDLSIFSNYKDNYIENLLTKESNMSFRDTLKNINFTQPSLSKKAFKRLKSSIQQNKSNFKSEIKNTINDFYNHSKITDSISNEKDFIIQRTIKQTIINEKIIALKDHLNNFKINLDQDKEFKSEKLNFEQKYNKAFEDIVRVPKRYKSFFGWVKADFYKKVMPERVRSLATLIEKEYSDIILKEEISRLFNGDIDNGIKILSSDIENNNVDKLNWINSNKTESTLKQNYDNIIYLESYFQRHIIDKIENDPEINASLIENYLAGENDFNTFIQHTDTMQYITELQSKNLYELKDLLTIDEINQIVNKVSELINPLWNRANINEINVGRADTSGKLISFNRVEVPVLNDNKVGNYFGENTFTINGSDIFPSENSCRQSFIKLELGLPAYLIKSMKKYKNTFDDEIKDNASSSINFFAYNDNRIKTLNGDTGIFVFEDDEELTKQSRAMYAWSFGWATGIFFKQHNRIKVKISQSFQSNPTNESKIRNGVYDAFKEFGQSTDLIRIFNTLKEDSDLLLDIENQLNEIQQVSNKDYLRQIAKTFEETSSKDKNQKFRTEKKAYSQLSREEIRLLNDREQEALKLGCEEIANSNSIKIDFQYETIGNEKYLRLIIR
jgi:hypothetical protein